MSPSPRTHLALVLHNHQPVGNFERVFERSFERAYRPFLDVVEPFESVRFTLHMSGPLWEWMERRHPEHIDRVARLVGQARVEVLTAGYYEPILPVIPRSDCLDQIARLSERVGRLTGVRPRGLWLAERVWEPSLPGRLAAAGVEYTIVDDHHFLGAGIAGEELYGYFVTDDGGARLRVVPGLKRLRYAIPFRETQETLAFLGEAAVARPEGLVCMADDGEKFGGWPGTADHVYTKGWLQRFLTEIAATPSIVPTRLSDYLDAHAPLGRVYLPTASYAEMEGWALPAARARERDEALRAPAFPDGDWVRGGFWRNFLVKYPESNRAHKKMLWLSDRLAGIGSCETHREARDHLHQAQCNDAYWHGVFGGLYLPHLRSAVRSHLLAAEAAMDRLEGRRGPWIDTQNADADADGLPEIRLRTERLSLFVDPAEGGSLLELGDKRHNLDLADVIARRVEPYHRDLRAAVTGSTPEVQTIHSVPRAKEEGLAARLFYDRTNRGSFLVRLLPDTVRPEDLRRVAIDDRGKLAEGQYDPEVATDGVEATIRLTRGSGGLLATKALRVAAARPEIAFTARVDGARAGERLALELNLNLLAGNDEARSLVWGEHRRRLAWEGRIQGVGDLALVDDTLGLRIAISTDAPVDVLVYPVETISLSEDGFERTFQGTCLILLSAGTDIAGILRLAS